MADPRPPPPVGGIAPPHQFLQRQFAVRANSQQAKSGEAVRGVRACGPDVIVVAGQAGVEVSPVQQRLHAGISAVQFGDSPAVVQACHAIGGPLLTEWDAVIRQGCARLGLVRPSLRGCLAFHSRRSGRLRGIAGAGRHHLAVQGSLGVILGRCREGPGRCLAFFGGGRADTGFVGVAERVGGVFADFDFVVAGRQFM